MDSIDSVVESDPNSLSDTSFDQNEDNVDDQQSEKSFIGFGEDHHLEQNFLQSTAKKLKKPDPDANEYNAPAEVKYLSKVAHKLVMETYSPFKPSDFEDRESIVNALNSVLLSISRDDRLREYIENSSHFIGFADSFNDLNQCQSYKNVSSPRESLESSLGVLSYSELSSFSSNEAIKTEIFDVEETSPNLKRSSIDFLSEIENLQHQNKRLNEEKSHLMQQMSQTEDMNSSLFHENQELQKKHQNWQALIEKLKNTEKDNYRLKLTLSNYEETNHTLQEKLTNFNKERMSLNARIKDLHEELTLVNQEVDTLRSTVDELNANLEAVNIQNSYLNEANDILNQNLEEKTEELSQKSRSLSEMVSSLECARAQKNELELLLCKAEEEIATLHYATQHLEVIQEQDSESNSAFSCSFSHDITVSPNCANCTETSKVDNKFHLPKGNFAISPIRNGLKASTPTKRKAILVNKPSLCAEMKDVVRSKGTPLPSPFCGKHIFPAALYSDTKLSLFDINTEMGRDTESYDETDSLIVQPKVPRLSRYSFDPDSLEVSSSIELNKSFQSPGTKSIRAVALFQDIKPEKLIFDSPIFLETIQEQLEEINASLISITAESTPTYQPYSDANGVINEPPPPSHPGGVDESLKDQINGELKVLRSQIAKTQAILSYLSRGQKLPAGIASLNSFIIEKDSKQRAKSELSGSFQRLSGDLLTSSETGHKKTFWSREHVRNPSYSPSQKSTPLHKSRWLTKSCPNLPSHWSVINRSTQTENSRMASEELSRTPVSELGTKLSATPLKTTPTTESPGSCDVTSPPTNREDDFAITVSPLTLRNRSLSYVTAIKKGNLDDSPSPNLASEEVVIVHDQTPDLKSPLEFPEDDNKNLKETSSLDDEIEGRFHDQQRRRLSSSKSENGDVECDQPHICSESLLTNLPLEKAKKRRRSFSEHNSSYSGTIDLEEQELDFVAAEQMQGTFVTTAGQVLSGTTSPVLTMDKIPVALPVSLSPPSVDVSAVKFPKASAAYTARAALSDKPKRLGRNPRFLMPDVMETSETESAKDSANGSMESETTEPVTTTTTVLSTATASVTITTVATAAPVTAPSGVDVLKPPPPGLDPSFPSLPDEFLRKLNLEKGSLLNTEEMTSQEVESKFGTLSLAFKTDKFTLSKRLELQKRQRDMAEGNIDKEVSAMKEALNALNHMCTDSQMRELIVKVQHHIDIVHQSTSRMSSRAEVYGAVQQEERMSHAYEIMVTYVENLKRLYQREHHELEDTRRVLIENRLMPETNGTGSGSGGPSDLFGSHSDDPKRPTRTSIASGSYKPQQQQQQSTRRRASVAVFHRPILEAAKSCIGTLSNFGVSASNGEFRARLYSAVTPLSSSLSPAKLEKLNAVSVSSSTSSPPAVTTQYSLTNNQRFPFPTSSSTSGSVAVHTGTSGPSRKSAIGSSATGPLNSLTGNEELLAALERVESNNEDSNTDGAKNTSQTEEAVSPRQESNNNELRNEVDSKDESNCSTHSNFSQTESPKPITHRNVVRDDRRNSPDSDRSQTPTSSGESSHPYARQLSRILFRRDPIRPNNTWLANWAPDDTWWSRWDFNSITRNFRYGFGIMLLLAAFFSIIFTFLPNDSTACNSSTSYSSKSVQEFFKYYVNIRKNNPTV